MKNPFSFGKFATILLVCTAVLSTGICVYVHKLDRTIAREICTYLQEFASQDARHIEMQIEEDLDTLQAMATALEVFEPSREKVEEFLSAQRPRHYFKNIAFVNLQGHAWLDNGEQLDVSQRIHFKRALAGQPNISVRLADPLDGQPILVEAVPVKQGGKIKGILMATRSTASFGRMLDMESFGGEGYSLLVNTAGDKVIESFHPNAVSGLYNIFNMPDDPNHRLEQQVRADFAAHKKGVINYGSEARGELYIAYQPLSINDWYLIAVVPSQHSSALTRYFVTLLLVLCILIAVFGMMLGAYVWHAWPSMKEE